MAILYYLYTVLIPMYLRFEERLEGGYYGCPWPADSNPVPYRPLVYTVGTEIPPEWVNRQKAKCAVVECDCVNCRTNIGANELS
jgi:hypothetical protein